MGKRQNDESGKKQPPKPRAQHHRRGGQIKEDLTVIRDRLDVMNARLGSLSSTEQDLKLARQECAEGARLLGEMTKERDLALKAKIQAIPADSTVVFVWADRDTTPDPETHLISKAFQQFGGDPQIVYVPRDFRVEAMTDRGLERAGLCRVSVANATQQEERDRFVRELGEAHRRLAQNEEELSSLRALACAQTEKDKIERPAPIPESIYAHESKDEQIRRLTYQCWVASRDLNDLRKILKDRPELTK